MPKKNLKISWDTPFKSENYYSKKYDCRKPMCRMAWGLQIVERTEVDQFKKAQKLADKLKKQRTAELERRRELALKKERWGHVGLLWGFQEVSKNAEVFFFSCLQK